MLTHIAIGHPGRLKVLLRYFIGLLDQTLHSLFND